MLQLLNKFRRVTSTGNYIPEIDGLRFLAVSWIFVYHLNDYLINFFPVNDIIFFQKILQNGHLGVELFFVISGFVLSLPFARYYLRQGKKVYLKQYFIRRLTRLEPPYFLIMIFLFFFKIITHVHTANELTPHLMASLFYAHNIIYSGTLPVINSVAWSLEIEIQFYIMMPLLAHVFTLQRNIRRVLLLSIMVMMPVVQYLFKSDTLFFYQFIQYFIAGFLLADIYVSYDRQYFFKPKQSLLNNVFIVLGAFAFASILIIHSTRTDLVYTIFIPLVILLFYSIVLFIPFWKNLFSIKWISIIGGMCYTIYLIHLPVMATFGQYFVKYKITNEYFVYFILQLLIQGTLTIFFSSLFFYFIEKPCMQKDWYLKLLKRGELKSKSS
jgi:peptidoglycan/LPS O-acetylase OafA/YrhL